MKELFERLKNVEVFNWPAAIFVLVMVNLLGPIYSSLSAGGSLDDWRRVFIATTLVYFLFVALAKLSFLKDKSIRQSPILSLASLIIAALIISLGTRLLAVFWLDLPVSRLIALRIVTISIASIVWHLALALVVYEEKKHRIELATLIAAIETSAKNELSASQQLIELRARTISLIEETLTKAWQKLRPSGSVREELLDVVNFIVRPLGREILRKEIPSAQTNIEAMVKVPWREKANRWATHLDSISIFDNLATPIAIAVVPYMSRNFIAAPLGAERGVLISYLLFFTMATVGKKLDRKLKARSSLKFRFRIAAGIVISVCFLDAYLFSVLFSAAEFGLSLSAVVGNLTICLVILFLRVVKFDRTKIIEELNIVSEQLYWSQARLRQLVWVERQRLANLVHGHIQSQIIATAARFETQNLSERETLALFKKLRRELKKIIRDESRTESIPKLLKSLKTLWKNSVDIKWSISSEAQKILEVDQNTADSVIEIIREGILNSVKHAQAKFLEVTILVAEDEGNTTKKGFLSVTVANDGKPFPKNLKKGQGLAFLDMAAAEWHLSSSTDQTLMKAKIAFQN